MTHTTREYGLLIDRKREYGTERVEVRVVAREADKHYPLGCSGDGESEFDHKVPKHAHGLLLDGLGMYGFVSDSDAAFIGHEVEYRSVFSLDLPKINRAQRTLKRVLARLSKDNAHEPGDRFMSLAAVLKLSFAVVANSAEVEARNGEKWRWLTIAEGRDRYRALIDEAQRQMRERVGLKAAS